MYEMSFQNMIKKAGQLIDEEGNEDHEDGGRPHDPRNKNFNLNDTFGPVISRWQNKSDLFNPSRSKKSRVNEVIDPSITMGILSFAAEAIEREERIKQNYPINVDYLSQKFQGSSILNLADPKEKIDGRLC